MIEIVLVLVVVLLILSPGKLAKISRSLGRALSPYSKRRKERTPKSQDAGTGRDDSEYKPQRG
jgi:Sec-independent protein translocase protein TatA